MGNPKLSQAQRRVLQHLAAGRRADTSCRTMGDHGGLGSTLASLHRRRWIDGSGDITDAGRRALARPERRRDVGEDYCDISSAPRDGTLVEVTDHETCTAVMRWNAVGTNWLVSDRPGIWEAPDESFTWCEDQGYGPTHWRPAPAEATGEGEET